MPVEAWAILLLSTLNAAIDALCGLLAYALIVTAAVLLPISFVFLSFGHKEAADTLAKVGMYLIPAGITSQILSYFILPKVGKYLERKLVILTLVYELDKTEVYSNK